VKYSREAYHTLQAKGAAPIYAEYQDAGHDIGKRAYMAIRGLGKRPKLASSRMVTAILGE
jgi:hypothetical protein